MTFEVSATSMVSCSLVEEGSTRFINQWDNLPFLHSLTGIVIWRTWLKLSDIKWIVYYLDFSNSCLHTVASGKPRKVNSSGVHRMMRLIVNLIFDIFQTWMTDGYFKSKLRSMFNVVLSYVTSKLNLRTTTWNSCTAELSRSSYFLSHPSSCLTQT